MIYAFPYSFVGSLSEGRRFLCVFSFFRTLFFQEQSVNVNAWLHPASHVRSSCVASVMALLWLCAALSPMAHGQDKYGFEDVQVGFEGAFKAGVWSPIRFRITGPSGAKLRAVVGTADPDGQLCRLPLGDPVSPGEEVSGLFCSWRLQASLLLELYDGETSVARHAVKVDGQQQVRCLKQSDQIWALDGDQTVFLSAAQRWNAAGSSNLVTVSLDSIVDAPSAESLESVDGIVLNAGTDLSPEFTEVLRQFVQRGGRLVIAIGDGAEALKASSLAKWLPILPLGQSNVRYLSGINEMVPGSATLRFLGTLPAGELDRKQGTAIASGLEFPLVQRAVHGIGTVTLVAVRLDQSPFTSWDETSSSELAARLAELEAPWSGNQDQNNSGEGLNPTGVSDLQTQLVHAADHFENVNRPSHQSVLLWLALFVVIIGPLDFLLVHFAWKRPEWTWGTALLAIAIASGWAISHARKANDVSLAARNIELIDLDVDTGLAQGRSVISFYSPETARREIAFETGPLVQSLIQEPPPLFRGEWATRPEDGFRGMYNRGGFDLAKPAGKMTQDRTGLTEVPTLIWSSVSVEADWSATADPGKLATVNLTDNGTSRLAGTFTSQLPCELEDWFLAYGDFMYYPDSTPQGEVEPISPGQEWSIGRLNAKLLRSRLIGLTSASSIDVETNRSSTILERASHDPLSRDAESICRTISFHDAMGGTEYTGLSNHILGAADLSELIRHRRAVLFGRAGLSATSLLVDGKQPAEGDSQTFVRIILPVQVEVAEGDLRPSQDLFEFKR